MALKEHWIIRLAPDRYRSRITHLGFIFGAACYILIYICGVSSIFLAPLVAAKLTPSAPIAQAVLWLLLAVGVEKFYYAYSCIMLTVLIILGVGYTLFESIRSSNACQPNT